MQFPSAQATTVCAMAMGRLQDKMLLPKGQGGMDSIRRV
jgi:hypothetical protein